MATGANEPIGADQGGPDSTSDDHPLVALLSREGRPVRCTVVLGFLGPSDLPTHRRLYFDRELLSFADVPADGVLLVETRAGAPLYEPSRVWVDVEAPLSWSAADPQLADHPGFTIDDVVAGPSQQEEDDNGEVVEPDAEADQELQSFLDGDLVRTLLTTADEDRTAKKPFPGTGLPCVVSGLVCPTTDCFPTPSCTTGSRCNPTPKCEPSTPRCPSPPTMRWCTNNGPC